jgi:DNA repair protein RadC
MKTKTRELKPVLYNQNINFGIPCTKLVMDIPEVYLKVEKCIVKDSKVFYDYIKETNFVVDSFGAFEVFGVAYLNRQNRIISVTKISEGGLTGTYVDLRKIFSAALCCGATAMILFHTHPSGNMVASGPDREITKTIINAGKIMDINVFDHVILGHDTYYSFADAGIL